MAQVPIQTAPVEQLGAGMPNVTGISGAAFSVPSSAAGRQGLALGEALMDAGKLLLQLQTQHDDALVKTNMAGYMSDLSAIESEFLGKPGTHAVEGLPAFHKTVEQLSVKYSDGLENDVQRGMFGQVVNKYGGAAVSAATQHAVKQQRLVNIAATEATRDMFADQAALFGVTDPTRSRRALEDALEQVRSLGELNGDPKEKIEGDMFTMKSKVNAAIASNLAANNNFTEAKAFLDDRRKAGEISAEDYNRLYKSVVDGYDAEYSRAVADSVTLAAGKAMTDKGAIMRTVMFNLEGGAAVNPKDGNQGASRYGVTQKTLNAVLPGAKAETLTEAQALRVYEHFWKAARIDSLPEDMRAVAFSTVINMGLGGFQQLYGQSGNDPVKFMKLREERYREIGGPYVQGWIKRMQREARLFYGASSVEEQVRNATGAAQNENQKDLIEARVKSNYKKQAELEQLDHDRAYKLALEATRKGEKVPVEVYQKLTKEELLNIVNPLEKSEPSAVRELNRHPELWTTEGLRPFRARLSVKDYNAYLAAGKDPAKVGEQTVNSIITDKILTDAGLGSYLTAQKGSKKHKELLDIKYDAYVMMNSAAKAYGRPLDYKEKAAIVRSLVKEVKVKMHNTFLGMRIGGETSGTMRAHQVKNFRNVIIPAAEKRAVEQQLRAKGVAVTPENVYSAWLQMK